jgi:antitoxin YefM
MSFTVNIGEAQARLPSLVRQDAFTICRRGKPVGVFLSAERLAALAETLELLAEPNFHAALRRLERGETPTLTLAEAETTWTRGTPRPDRKARRRVHR